MKHNYYILPLLILILLPLLAQGQITGDAPPFVLTVEQGKNWTPDGPTASVDNIATVPLAPRFVQTNSQLNPALSNDIKILSAPDGMNNLGNYATPQSQFNLFNFTHWQYIDVLNWFGGTASQNIVIPSAPWVNAAHRNGVKVIGSVFFGPTVFGGNTAIIQEFLEKDAAGNYILADKLIDIANYYGFDGWLFNQETSTTLEVALEFRAFLAYMQEKRPAGMEIHWYDAMIETGPVIWQNQLNSLNDAYLQDVENLQRTSDAMFTNYNWTSAYVTASSNYATALGRSKFDVYMGADLWPDRNAQPAFDDINWINSIFNGGNISDPLTSIALFAMNFTYFRFNDFANDPNDVQGFYDTERRFFAGDDRDIDQTDGNGQWKGIGHFVPAKSVISSLPFTTEFNTGHGRILASNGVQQNQDWHDMSQQDILPSWQFALSGSSPLTPAFDFTTAYNGGSSLKISGTLPAGEVNQLKLYKTKLHVSGDTKVELTYSVGSATHSNANLLISFSSAPDNFLSFAVGDDAGSGWKSKVIDLGSHSGKEIAIIGLEFNSASSVNNYAFNLGRLQVYDQATPVCAIRIDDTDTTAESCPGAQDGSALISASCTACTTIEYSLDGVNFQASNFFYGLVPGNYTLSARDVGNPTCIATDSFTIGAGPAADSDGDGTIDCEDNCPDDPDKTEEGECGCGVADIDTDNDGTLDCNDGCPDDPNKTEPGNCGCGKKEQPNCNNGNGGSNGNGNGNGGGLMGANTLLSDFTESREESLYVFPNPTEDILHLEYNLSQAGQVSIRVLDLNGRPIATIMQNRVREAGFHKASWNAQHLPKGVYLIQVQSSANQITQRIIKN